MDYKVEPNGTLEHFGQGRGRKPKYPFKTMRIDDVFPFRIEEYDRVVFAMAKYMARHSPTVKFHISRVDLLVKRVA